MRRRVPERLCLMLGSALVLAAVCLYVYDRLEDARAGAQAASAVSQLRQSQSIAAVSETEQPADSAESLPTEDAESGPEPASETPASSVETAAWSRRGGIAAYEADDFLRYDRRT